VSAVFHNPVYVLGFRKLARVAIGTTLLCALVGIPLSLLFQRWEFPGRRARRLDPSAVVVPPFVGALAIQRLLGPNAPQCGAGRVRARQPFAPVDWLREGRFFAVIALPRCICIRSCISTCPPRWPARTPS